MRRIIIKWLSVSVVILIFPSLIFTLLSVQTLSYSHIPETDWGTAQKEATQKIKRIVAIGDRFGVTTTVLTFTVQFQASTTAIVGLPVTALGPNVFAPVKTTFVEVKNCASSIEKDAHYSLADCFGKSKTYNIGGTHVSIMERLAHEDYSISFRPDFLSVIMIFGIIYILWSTFVIVILKVSKMAKDLATDQR
ncbi:MAG: hypothetical protein AAB476_00110 [Patescibacteria group bacterium]